MDDGAPVLKDRYQLERPLGAGGMGRVFLALDLVLNRHVALKFLPPIQSSDEETSSRFQREFLALTQLSHDNVIQVFDYDLEGGEPFFVMEYLEGKALNDWVDGVPQDTAALHRLLQVFIQVCTALSYIHDRGIIHRDLKPSNIWVTPDETVKLVDFGLAKHLDSMSLTQTGSVVGTPRYMSPEQAEGKQLDQRTDLYSLGIAMYETLTGVAPYHAVNPLQLLDSHRDELPSTPRFLNPIIPNSVEQVIITLMEKNPASRYPSASVVQRKLQEAASFLEWKEPGLGEREPAPAPEQRNGNRILRWWRTVWSRVARTGAPADPGD